MDETGYELVRELDVPMVVSALALVEVPAAIWRKQRTGALEKEDARVLVTDFLADYSDESEAPMRFYKMGVTTPILERACGFTADYGLRGYDAVQLASAVTAHEVDRGCDTLVGFDRDLGLAARAEGLMTIGFIP